MSGGFLSRWSRRKLAAAVQTAPERDAASAAPAPVVPGDVGAGAVVSASPDAVAASTSAPTASPETQLPPVESLSLSSDFTAFLKEEVSEALRRKALQKLFSDPHFNRMDGLDIYIGDYSQPDPIPPEIMAKLQHAREWLMDNEAVESAAGALPAMDGAAPEAAATGEAAASAEAAPAPPAALGAEGAEGIPGERSEVETAVTALPDAPPDAGQNAP
ncbi:MAG: DUF3306 domain-containing protein [Thauera sp.]